MWLQLLAGKSSTHLVIVPVSYSRVHNSLLKCCVNNYRPLPSFFQRLRPPPQPAGTAVPPCFPRQQLQLLVSKQISSHLMWWQSSPMHSLHHQSSLAAAISVSSIRYWDLLKSAVTLHVSESVISLHFHHLQLNLKCNVPRPKTKAGFFCCETPFMS